VQLIVTPIDDSLIELDETIELGLQAGQNYFVSGPSAAGGTITSAEFGGDFGDAPAPYPTTLAERGAGHGLDALLGPRLGSLRDTEVDGTHSALADADGDDDDGVTFGAIRVGQLGAIVTVNVENAPSGARLDAWIDFDGDGNWGGPAERIADSVSVVNGNHLLEFDVPSGVPSGEKFARFRVSTAGSFGVDGAAGDGEVEDYAVTIQPPAAASGVFGENVVTATADEVWSAIAADVDGDGDMDIPSTSGSFLNQLHIVWHENDGAQSFTAHDIDPASNARSLFAADMDGDGDLDVVSASFDNDTVAWYENDGTPGVGVWTEHVISTSANGVWTVYAADVDGDGDLDVLSASQLDDKIAWYENDGNQNFTAHSISTAANSARSVYAADVDGDGDMDVLSASSGDNEIAWYENNGAENFMAHTISTAAGGARSVFAADVDGDGDLDVLSASRSDDKIAWYENDGAETFTAHTISVAANGAQDVYAADMEGDGDLDVLSASEIDGKLAWYENDGANNFTAHTITTGLSQTYTAYPADLDGDGDLDVLSASRNDDKIAWYENLGSLAGDYDRDLDVDDDDYAFWKTNFGATTGPGLTADGNGDGVVDAADYTVWLNNLGATLGAGAGAAEPGLIAQAPTEQAAASAEQGGGAVAATPLSARLESTATPTDDVLVASRETSATFSPRKSFTDSARATDRAFQQWSHRRADILLALRRHQVERNESATDSEIAPSAKRRDLDSTPIDVALDLLDGDPAIPLARLGRSGHQ
jgi:hypothetical protein